MVVYAVALVVIDPVLGLIAIASTVLTLLALRRGLNRQRQLSQVLVVEQAMLNATTAYGAVTMETIKAGGLEGDYHGRWEGTAVRVNEARQRMAVAAQVGDSVPFLLRSLLAAGVLCVGGLRVMNGSLDVGSLVAFQSAAVVVQRPGRRAGRVLLAGAAPPEHRAPARRRDGRTRRPRVRPRDPERWASRAGRRGSTGRSSCAG